jgi:Leucine-rich repeat (LRR) protein
MKKIPENIMLFRELNTLVLYGNQISAIPSSLIQLKNLRIININFNPVQTIEPLSGLLKNLEELSIKETGISKTEVDILKQKFPNCKIQSE